MIANPRSIAKLIAARSGVLEDQPSGRTPFELFFGLLICVWIVLVPLILLTVSFTRPELVDPAAAVALSAASVAIAGVVAWFFYKDNTKTPFRSVTYFLNSALQGGHSIAYAMLVQADKDDLPRRSGEAEFTFAAVDGFRGYWESVRRSGGGIGRVLVDTRHEITMLDDDLALVKFALLDDNGKRGTDLRKLTVRVGDEWHLFNGEWSSPEDDDTSWTAHAAPHSPALRKN